MHTAAILPFPAHPFAPATAPTCMLDSLNRRGQLADRRWRAGMILRGRWLRAQALPEDSARRAKILASIDRAMKSVESAQQYVSVFGVAVYGDPPTGGRLPDLQRGLLALAKHWHVPADFSREERGDSRSHLPQNLAYSPASSAS